MKEQEIVDAWKNNDRYFDSPNITDEMREWANTHIGDMQFYCFWEGWIKSGGANMFNRQLAYRLRSNFKLPKKEEFEYLEIKPQEYLSMRCYIIGTTGIIATEAPSIVGFAGYTLDADDSDEPRREFEPRHRYVKIKKDVK
jgi:hypothetical protein